MSERSECMWRFLVRARQSIEAWEDVRKVRPDALAPWTEDDRKAIQYITDLLHAAEASSMRMRQSRERAETQVRDSR